MELNQEKVTFMRGVLAAFASNGQLVHYDEVMRLCKLSREQMGAYLNEARKNLPIDSPDSCAIVINTKGVPGPGWGDPKKASEEMRWAHQYWKDRRNMKKDDFLKEWENLPLYPAE